MPGAGGGRTAYVPPELCHWPGPLFSVMAFGDWFGYFGVSVAPGHWLYLYENLRMVDMSNFGIFLACLGSLEGSSKKCLSHLGVVAHTCYPSTWEGKAGRSEL
ncbi:rCG47979, isoform CRA_a [Rattus norvegicus]|uniref:RCG47979, isoform CRA_a n=1 Tax=Rattus norvegicus TaxID=10116 RepID=A6HYJ1_RAT|nr:rCG47979, isoform CRA_a [Rattus norvegicus]EDM12272.1 rCG47979, isoform CRA_a [Rattus norvegicus]EDM12273.1 rCG47979, isoform CRA_a [Rattus norvegicus]